MKKLLVATNNPGKITEFTAILSNSEIKLITPKDVGLESLDPEETGSTFEENALIKAKEFAQKSNLPSMADDSGLEVDALDGRPGVHSKRYGNDDQHRIQKILSELKNTPSKSRTAHFTSVICIYNPQTKKHNCAQGRVAGKISLEPRGTDGFGYDPIFIPKEIPGEKTFAQLGPKVKNKISHRARALKKVNINKIM